MTARTTQSLRSLQSSIWAVGSRRGAYIRKNPGVALPLLDPLPTFSPYHLQSQRHVSSSSKAPCAFFSSSPCSASSKGKAKESSAEENPKIGLTVHVSDQDRKDFARFAQLLQARMPKGASNFHAVVPQDAHGQLCSPLSLSDPFPLDLQAAIFIPFPSEHPAGRHAFWNTSALLLGAALSQLYGANRCLLTGSPRLLEKSAGGSGFSYEFLRRSEDVAGAAVVSSYTDAVEEVRRLIESQSDQPQSIPVADFQQLETIIAQFASQGASVTTEMLSKEQALQIFNINPFKIERILATDAETIKVVRIGSHFIDLAPEGPLLSNLAAVKALKLTEWSTATFIPSDPSHPATSLPTTQPLLSLRGISFPNEKLLKTHMQAIKEAIESSHHAIGKAQQLFLTHPSSPGTPFILPHGVRLARKMERVIRDLYNVHEYDEVISPQLYKKDLWVRSGHWENYRDDMFSVEGFGERDAREAELVRRTSTERDGCCAAHSSTTSTSDESFGLKPMNCPGHCLIFASQPRTIKDLPIRFAEWSPLHRNESSGSLSGLTRVRRFHQDDAHVFCAASQVASEIKTMLQMLSEAYRLFGFPQFELVLSTRPANFIGSIEEWDRAESGLKDALNGTGLNWDLNEADGAFYGPKIDVRLVDALGRKHQTATIQLDFQLPQRFDLSYEDVKEPGGRARPVLIHRAILGSVERFMAILIESRGSHWPFWISPRQAIVIPVADTAELTSYAKRVQKYLSLGFDADGLTDAEQGDNTLPSRSKGRPRPTQTFHVDVDDSAGDTLGRRIKRAQMARYNFTLVVGEQELKNQTVHVRLRGGNNGVGGGGAAGQEGREDAARLERMKEAFGTEVQWKQDMGEWRWEDLRDLFCKLDSWHL